MKDANSPTGTPCLDNAKGYLDKKDLIQIDPSNGFLAALAIVVTRSQSTVHVFQPCAGGSTDHIRLILLKLEWPWQLYSYHWSLTAVTE